MPKYHPLTIQRPELQSARTLTPLEVNGIHLSTKRTVLTARRLAAHKK